MPSPTTTQGLLGIFPLGTDTPLTDLSAPTLPIRLPTSSSLWAILAARADGWSTRGRASGRNSSQEEEGRRAGDGGRNGNALGRPRGEAETGRRMTVWGRMMADMELGQ